MHAARFSSSAIYSSAIGAQTARCPASAYSHGVSRWKPLQHSSCEEAHVPCRHSALNISNNKSSTNNSACCSNCVTKWHLNAHSVGRHLPVAMHSAATTTTRNNPAHLTPEGTDTAALALVAYQLDVAHAEKPRFSNSKTIRQQVLYGQHSDWTNDLQCLGVGGWVFVCSCQFMRNC